MADKAVVDPQSQASSQQGPNIDSILNEQRKFEPPAEFSQHAHIKSLAEYEAIYKESVDDPDKFWSRIASETALVQEVGQGSRMELPVGEVVRRRPNQPFL